MVSASLLKIIYSDFKRDFNIIFNNLPAFIHIFGFAYCN